MIGAVLTKWMTRRSFTLMNRKDVVGLVRGWVAEGVFEFPGHTAVSGRYEGKPALEAFFRFMFIGLATIHFNGKRIVLTRPFAIGLTNTFLAEWSADKSSLKCTTTHLEGVSVGQSRRGQAIVAREYIFDPTALEPVWVRKAPAPTVPAEVSETAAVADATELTRTIQTAQAAPV